MIEFSDTDLTPRRAFAIGAVGLTLLCAAVLWTFDPQQGRSLGVLASFWASGDALSHGLDPYGQFPLTPIVTGEGHVLVDINLNPPAFLPLCQLLALLDIGIATRGWLLASLAGFLLGIRLLIRKETSAMQVLWAMTGPMVLSTLLLVQIYVLLLAAAAWAWLSLRQGRLATAGVALGLLVAMKPNFALALLVLAAAGHWRPVLWAAGAAAALSALPVLVYGPEIYGLWLRAVAQDGHFVFSTDASLIGYATRLGLRPVGLGLAAGVALLTLAVAWRRRPDAMSATALGLLASVLCSPLAWFHYLLVLVPALLERRWTPVETLCAALLFLPSPLLVQFQDEGLVSAPLLQGFYTITVLILLAGWLAPFLAPRRIAPVA